MDVPDAILVRRGERSENPLIVGPHVSDADGDSIRLNVPEEGGELVIVLLRNRIEHMVVAAGTAQRQPQKQRAGRAHHFVDFVPGGRLLVVGLVVENAEAVKTGGDDRLVRRIGQFVAGKLFEHEAVVRLVVIEGGNHVIAIAPRFGLFRVALIAVGLRKSRHVEPMSPPPFAVLLAGKQLVDKPLIRLRRVIGCEAVNFLGRRGQSDEIEKHAADERPGIGRRIRRQSLFFEAGEHKSIDRIGDPIGTADLRDRGMAHRLESPILAVLIGDREF